MGVRIEHGAHDASMNGPAVTGQLCRFTSWLGVRADSLVLRTATATALDQIEASSMRSRNEPTTRRRR